MSRCRDAGLDLAIRGAVTHPRGRLLQESTTADWPEHRERHGLEQRRLPRAVDPEEHMPPGLLAGLAGEGQLGVLEPLDIADAKAAEVHRIPQNARRGLPVLVSQLRMDRPSDVASSSLVSWESRRALSI